MLRAPLRAAATLPCAARPRVNPSWVRHGAAAAQRGVVARAFAASPVASPPDAAGRDPGGAFAGSQARTLGGTWANGPSGWHIVGSVFNSGGGGGGGYRDWSARGPWLEVQGRHFATATASGSGGDDDKANAAGGQGPGKAPGLFDRERTVAPLDYNRWKTVPGSFLVQLSIGSVYAWSIFNEPITRLHGVVAPAAQDWALGSVVPIFSACAVMLGVCTAVLGPWAERSGPRKVAAASATMWSGGLLLTSIGCTTHTLPLLYLGYGVLGGVGWGLGYISPVSTLMKWFPDRRGLATGLALTAFGGGAMVATPINEALMAHFQEAPTYLGPVSDVHLVTEAGKRFADVAGELQEVVVANAKDIAKLADSSGLMEGVYIVGTGDSGVGKTFLTLSGMYLTAMLIGAFNMRVPHENWLPAGYTPPAPAAAAADADAGAGGDGAGDKKSVSLLRRNDMRLHPDHAVDYRQALRTPQFYLLWGAVAGNAIAGVSVISTAKTLMNDCFGAAMPAVVTSAFAASYVAALSASNMVGRLGWASVSDYLGRKNMYFMFGLGAPIAASIPWITGSIAGSPGSAAPLVLFYGGTVLIVSFYGGLFSVLPAYLADVFGQRHVGAIHGRALTAWSAAALLGPSLLAYLRNISYSSALADLADKVDAATFRDTFGAGKEQLAELVSAKTVTINKLMDVVPAGTVDPTPSLYNTTMYSMAGLLTVAMLCNAAIRPVDPKHYIANISAAAAASAGAGAAAGAGAGAGAGGGAGAASDAGSGSGSGSGSGQAKGQQ